MPDCMAAVLGRYRKIHILPYWTIAAHTCARPGCIDTAVWGAFMYCCIAVLTVLLYCQGPSAPGLWDVRGPAHGPASRPRISASRLRVRTLHGGFTPRGCAVDAIWSGLAARVSHFPQRLEHVSEITARSAVYHVSVTCYVCSGLVQCAHAMTFKHQDGHSSLVRRVVGAQWSLSVESPVHAPWSLASRVGASEDARPGSDTDP